MIEFMTQKKQEVGRVIIKLKNFSPPPTETTQSFSCSWKQLEPYILQVIKLEGKADILGLSADDRGIHVLIDLKK